MGWSTADIPDQQGRIALITGASSGLGLETARALHQKGATVVMACRSPRKAEAARQQLLEMHGEGALDLVDLDLADLASVGRCSDAIHQRYGRLDLLINNAGVMAPPRLVSESVALLRWMETHNFTFIGYREYRVSEPIRHDGAPSSTPDPRIRPRAEL